MVDSVRKVAVIVGQINAAITAMDQVTQKNAAMVEEAAPAASEISDQAAHLDGVIAHFRPDASPPPAQPRSRSALAYRPGPGLH